MNVSLLQTLPLLVALLAAPAATQAWLDADAEAATLRATLAEERAVLACARAAAVTRNLDAARAYLTRRHPELTGRLALAADDLEADLIPAPPLPPPGAAGRCRSDGPRRLAASLHLERHAGQPEPWPNWIVRWDGVSP